MLATGNWLLPSGNRLPESITLGKRFFLEKISWTKLCYSIFWKTLLILILIESSLDSLLESWFLIEWLFDSWNLLDSWFLTWVFGIIKINLEIFASITIDAPVCCQVFVVFRSNNWYKDNNIFHLHLVDLFLKQIARTARRLPHILGWCDFHSSNFDPSKLFNAWKSNFFYYRCGPILFRKTVFYGSFICQG